jgi:hypothetical protein
MIVPGEKVPVAAPVVAAVTTRLLLKPPPSGDRPPGADPPARISSSTVPLTFLSVPDVSCKLSPVELTALRIAVNKSVPSWQLPGDRRFLAV